MVAGWPRAPSPGQWTLSLSAPEQPVRWVAGRLAAGSSGRTLLLEAGPDYGPAGSGRWPRDLLDAASSPLWSHDWGYTGEFGGQVINFNRARVVGGCSAHNACAVVFGSRFDYDGWAAAGNPGWSARELAPLFASAWKQLRVRRVGLEELTPFQRICRDAIVANGIPAVEDFNDLDQDAGIAPFPVNIDGATRVNSAFGYVDPVRDRLVVVGDAPVERVLIRGSRVAGVAVPDGQRLEEIRASRVVLCAGAYGSPAILLRSGIGPAGEAVRHRGAARAGPARRRTQSARPAVSGCLLRGKRRPDPADGAPPDGDGLATPRAGDREVSLSRMLAGVRPAYLPGRRPGQGRLTVVLDLGSCVPDAAVAGERAVDRSRPG